MFYIPSSAWTLNFYFFYVKFQGQMLSTQRRRRMKLDFKQKHIQLSAYNECTSKGYCQWSFYHWKFYSMQHSDQKSKYLKIGEFY